MRRNTSSLLFLFLPCLFSLFLAACVTPKAGKEAEVSSGQSSPSIRELQMMAYEGPKARIAVSRFTNKAGGDWFSQPIGEGLADQMSSALSNTGRYMVLEREAVRDVLSEQDRGASGRIRQDTQAATEKTEGAELLIAGAVTDFSGNSPRIGGGIGGAWSGILAAISGGYKKSHMAIDVRVTDKKTSKILAVTNIEGEAGDVNLGGMIGGYGGSGALAAGLVGWKNTPMEKAMRICIKKAVEFIVSGTPREYYRHGTSQPPVIEALAAVKPKTFKKGLTREVVRHMQSYLASLGYNVGPIDGIAGKKTRKAVLKFQEDNQMELTGKLDPATMKKLREVAAK